MLRNGKGPSRVLFHFLRGRFSRITCLFPVVIVLLLTILIVPVVKFARDNEIVTGKRLADWSSPTSQTKCPRATITAEAPERDHRWGGVAARMVLRRDATRRIRHALMYCCQSSESTSWCVDPGTSVPAGRQKKGPEGDRLCRAWCFGWVHPGRRVNCHPIES
jgi:hypothetical protein